WRRSARPRSPGASAMARFLYTRWRAPYGFGRERRARTRCDRLEFWPDLTLSHHNERMKLMQTAKDVLKTIKDKDIKYVDLRFTDPRCKWQHVTFDVALIEEDTFTDGVMFDGSSIAGWKAINESDMTLLPDAS